MADREPNRVEGPHRPSRWISGHLFIALLTILLAAGMWVRTHTHAPQGSGTASVLRSDETEPPTTAPTSHPSTAPAILTQPATTEVFSEEYITSASTALVRSDGQGGAIYEPIDEGTALTIFDDPATHASDELVRARMNSGVEGRVPAGRLKGVRVRKLVLLPPAVEPIALAALGGMARIPGVQVNAVDSKNVQRAIDIGLKFLLGAQRSNGSWEPLDAPVAGAADGSLHGAQWGFASGLASEALLAAGQTPGAPAVGGALNWLTSAPMKGTYAVSARDRFMDRYLASASTTLHTKSARTTLKTDRDQILFSLNLNANKRAWHGYLLTRAVQNLPAGNNALPPATDRLATTFAMEGAIACERSGAEVPRSYWDANRNTLLLEQSRNMGFARQGAPTQADPESVLATAAGALAVDIADFFVGSSGYKCNGSMQPSPAARAWDRLGTAAQVFVPVQLEPGTPPLFDNVMPMLVAETARMLGRKDLGGVPVYLMVAGQLLKTQNPDGSWGAAGQPQAVSVVETALAIITLAEVRAPVAMNKVVPRPADNRDWNERPRDVANFIDWFERDSTTSTPNVPRASWQAVALVNLNDLQTSNVLYIGGAEPFNLAPAEVQLLTQFVANGGTIVGSADCGKKGFAKSFALAAGAILPGQAGKELPPNHPLFAAQDFKAAKWKVQPKVIGWTMQNREAILLIPESDAGKWWAMQAATTKRELFELGANIVQYAGGPKAR